MTTAETTQWFHMVDFNQWWQGINGERLPLVDIRSLNEYESCRIEDPNVLVVHLPLDSLKTGERSAELPPRNVNFAVMQSNDTSTTEQVIKFFGATTSRATLQSRKPWRVCQVLVACPELWKQACENGASVKNGVPSPHLNTCSDENVFSPLPRLWQPDPLVKNFLLPLLKSLIPLKSDNEVECAQVWDLGSGAGRDVCFLAEELKRSQAQKGARFKIVGIDNHKASAQRCVPFWKHRGVADETEALLLNLNKVDLVHECLSNRNVVCFYAVRFWNRKLVHFLANNLELEPGTLFAMSHFCKQHVDATWEFDHPKEKHVLERDEVQLLFEQHGKWEVLHNEIGFDGDHGRTLIHFVARRVT